MKKSKASEDGHKYRWWVPLSFTSVDGDFDSTFSRHWLSPDDKDKTINGMPGRNTAVVFNVKQTGMYSKIVESDNSDFL